MSKQYDILIVGQGLAGINASYEARKRGLSVFHVHKSMPGESTKIAAGLINPITGRRFVKSWMIDEVMPFAEERYLEFEKLLGQSFISRINIVRVLKDIAAENAWLAKTADPYLREFMLDQADFSAFDKKMSIPDLLSELKNCFRISLMELQQQYLRFLQEENGIEFTQFKHSDFEILEDGFVWAQKKFKNVIFAEGWNIKDNPHFSIDSYEPAKGELLIIKSPELKLDKAYKKNMFIIPLEDDLYWVGATYRWKKYIPEPTEEIHLKIVGVLDELLKVPYEIIHHYAGIRPSSTDRRPIVGRHNKHRNMYIFNGMGTKGTSLSPYFSVELLDLIQHNKEVNEEVDVRRFYCF